MGELQPEEVILRAETLLARSALIMKADQLAQAITAALAADPSRSHSHPYTDENHDHPPRSAEDAPWPEGD